ncbi:MAG: amidohydrolase family protein, partial [Bacteroidetes bacterium]|nr:amidohydrolase family protein [Bacteroidota bacterium]
MRKRLFPPGKHGWLFPLALFFTCSVSAQQTFPLNGVAEPKTGSYALTNATIVKDGQTTLSNATIVVRDGKIVAVGAGVAAPKDAVVIDCSGKYIYPSFIDIYSDYGIPTPQRTITGFNFGAPQQFTSNQKGAFGWNQAIRSDVSGADIFVADEAKAKTLRDAGFGTVLTHQKDGIVRGTGVVVTLANKKENLVLVKDKAAAFYSLSKGTSTQAYPSSMMGCVALLRQTYLDAQWYKGNPSAEGVNLTLKAFNEEQSLPQVFEGGDKWTDLRGDRIGKEFGVQYIIKGGNNEYQRIKEIAETKASFILPLDFPQAMDVEDPNDARFVSLADMKHWELAPTNPGAFEKAGIPFCLTAADLRDTKQFMTNLRKAIEYGLTEGKAFDALTKTPATLMGIYDKVGSLDAGKLANFLVTSGPIFNEKTVVYQNWVQGEKYAVNEAGWNNIAGTYNLVITSAGGATTSYTLDVKSAAAANVIGKDTLTGKFSYDGKLVKLSFSTTPARRGGMGMMGGQRPEGAPAAAEGGGRPEGGFQRGGGGRPSSSIRLSGASNGTVWQGIGEDTAGNKVLWTASFVKAAVEKTDSAGRRRPPLRLGKVTYPFDGYGWEELPKQETILIKNATVWTNEKDGKLLNTDVLIKDGKIAQVGKNLPEAGAKVIDGTGKHVTAGVIDEHSHIAAFSINEGAQSVTSEVRIADNLN